MPEQPTATDVRDWADEFNAVGERIGRRFARSELWRWVVDDLCGSLSDAERKNGWPLAEKASDHVRVANRVHCFSRSQSPGRRSLS